MSTALGVVNVILTTVLLGAVGYMSIESDKNSGKLVELISTIEDNVILNIKKDIKTLKPETYQELLIKSDRIFSHVIFLAEKNYDGDVMHPDLVEYADRAYDSVMENMYDNLFYKRLYEAGVMGATVEPFQIDEQGNYFYGDNVSVESGVFIRGKYHLDMQGDSIYSRLKDIPAGIMLMGNDLLMYPSCELGMRPFVIFGELYPKGGKAHGVNLYTENQGWRVSFKDVDIMSDEALENRLIFQTACQNIDEEPASPANKQEPVDEMVKDKG